MAQERRRRIAVLAATAAAIAAVACGEYTHTNPYDPLVPVSFTITGPETLTSLAQVGAYAVQTSPVFPDTAFTWATSDSIYFMPSGVGSFTSASPPLYPLTKTVAVYAQIGQEDTTIGVNGAAVPTYVWRHTGTYTVVLTQKVTRIQLRCPDTHACATESVGGVWSVWVDGLDSLGRKIVSLTSATANPLTGSAIATFAVRDSTVAGVIPVGIRAADVTALKSGTTWIVATRGTLLDSLQLVVQ